ncbi:hypothetical protein MSG28_003406 [Choristoneura fumiferana]|uniref:Uncharacterized protein n=1 Tax=Choristoneura fumiferana TaxID=7141 RepID=A0ACC0KES7_CHOFU|nr:hypothetical protein MSG28_003406 [Choristoneura fumiferana]
MLWGAGGAGHSATRRPTAAAIMSWIPCSSSLAVHHQKYFGSVTQPERRAASHSNAPQPAAALPRARPWPRCAARFGSSNPSAAEARGAGLPTLQSLDAHFHARSRLVHRRRGNDLGVEARRASLRSTHSDEVARKLAWFRAGARAGFAQFVDRARASRTRVCSESRDSDLHPSCCSEQCPCLVPAQPVGGPGGSDVPCERVVQ